MAKAAKKQTGSSKPKENEDKKLHLEAKKREILGKQVKKLRRENILPANIYGADFKSIAIQVDIIDFKTILKSAGETSIVYLALEGEKDQIPALIQNIAYHPVSGHFLHADFRKVDLKKKIQTAVPVKIIGESEPVAQNLGVLQTSADSLSVEALPDQIPNSIEIDISGLNQVGDEIKLKDIKSTGNYVFVDDPEKLIVRIIEHKEEEITPQAQEPVEGGKEAEEGVEKKEEAEAGEKPATEEKAQEKPEEKEAEKQPEK